MVVSLEQSLQSEETSFTSLNTFLSDSLNMILKVPGLFGGWLLDYFLNLFAMEVRVVVLRGVGEWVVFTLGASAQVMISRALSVVFLVVGDTG